MIKRGGAMLMCLTLVVIFSIHAEGKKSRAPVQAKIAWVIEMSRDGGMRPRKESVRITSDGEITVTSEHRVQGQQVVDCSLKEKLSAEDLLKLKEAVRAARYNAWPESYEDPKHPVCCDQPTTHLTLQRRTGAGGVPKTFSTSWYPSSSQLRPADLEKLAATAQTLWNKTREHCKE
jgi:hypothetical protein